MGPYGMKLISESAAALLKFGPRDSDQPAQRIEGG